LSHYDAYTKSGAYTQSGFANAVAPIYHELRGKTWGIYGLGNIGERVAEVAEAFGCRVLACKRTPSEKYETVSLDTLCQKSDILTVHTPLTPETRGSINKERLDLMKKGSILVNVARGAVLAEDAVADAVLSGRLGGFGCDVYTEEPFGASHPYQSLCGLQNVILTPHMAWGAKEARERCMDEIKKNIEAFLAGKKRNRVDG
jgi:glycerate dehydrogenase